MRKRRNSKGVGLAESAASLSLLLPIVMLVVYGIVQVTQAFLIKDGLTHAAREAARNLAIQYGQDPSIAGSRSLQDAAVFDLVRINNIVNASAQFDDPVFVEGANPPRVTVTVRYTGGQNSLPPYPNPDLFNLGNNYTIAAASTYRLE